MVRSIVIPHDPARSPRLRELADAGAFQEAVGGWLDLIEMPALGVTVYMSEAARRTHAPINCRAMAIWWLFTADPLEYPVILGDVVLTGSGDDEGADVPDCIVREIFEAREFVVQVRPYGFDAWHDTYARFDSVFDAATWCMLLSHTLRAGALFRLCSRTRDTDTDEHAFVGGEDSW